MLDSHDYLESTPSINLLKEPVILLEILGSTYFWSLFGFGGVFFVGSFLTIQIIYSCLRGFLFVCFLMTNCPVHLSCQIYWHALLTVFSCYPFIAVEFRAMAPLVFLMLINFLFLFSWLICVEVYQCYWSSQRTSVGSLFLLLFFCYLCWFMFPSLHFPSFDLLCVEFVLFLVLYVGCGAICLWPFLFFCDLNVWFSPESCFKGIAHILMRCFHFHLRV